MSIKFHPIVSSVSEYTEWTIAFGEGSQFIHLNTINWTAWKIIVAKQINCVYICESGTIFSHFWLLSGLKKQITWWEFHQNFMNSLTKPKALLHGIFCVWYKMINFHTIRRIEKWSQKGWISFCRIYRKRKKFLRKIRKMWKNPEM